MYCSHCGAAAQGGASFCDKCGKPLVASATGFADTHVDNVASTAIWNPNAAANWSLLFTPAFGAYLQMRNWRALGEPDKAASSQVWFYLSLAYLGLMVLMGLFWDSKNAEGLGRALGIALLIAWYFGSGRVQAKYVKDKLGKDYARRPWGKAILIALGVLAGYFAFAVVVGLIAAVF